ncbi:MAG: NUDIX domain-containing protein, partial [Candidatus Kariarchaeaceae archaeon]
HLDISVGGHVVGDGPNTTFETAYREMEEELGLIDGDLKDGELSFISGYESYDENKRQNFYNAEWRDILLGEITTEGFDKIRFSDKEVVGLYLCPISEANNLLTQKTMSIASALRLSLPKCLKGMCF